jgi:hypothetical protein
MTPAEFLADLHRDTIEPVWLETIPDNQHVTTRRPYTIDSFAERHDRRGRGIYVCVSTIAGERRNKETAREAPAVQVDIDGKDIAVSLDDAARTLRPLRFPPSRIVWSRQRAARLLASDRAL